MFFMTESGNPFDYMSNIWTVFIVVLVVCGVLLVVLKPLHKYWTDKKTRQLIDETGGPAPAVENPFDDKKSQADDKKPPAEDEESQADDKKSQADDEAADEDDSKD